MQIQHYNSIQDMVIIFGSTSHILAHPTDHAMNLKAIH